MNGYRRRWQHADGFAPSGVARSPTWCARGYCRWPPLHREGWALEYPGCRRHARVEHVVRHPGRKDGAEQVEAPVEGRLASHQQGHIGRATCRVCQRGDKGTGVHRSRWRATPGDARPIRALPQCVQTISQRPMCHAGWSNHSGAAAGGGLEVEPGYRHPQGTLQRADTSLRALGNRALRPPPRIPWRARVSTSVHCAAGARARGVSLLPEARTGRPVHLACLEHRLFVRHPHRVATQGGSRRSAGARSRVHRARGAKEAGELSLSLGGSRLARSQSAPCGGARRSWSRRGCVP